MSNKYERQAEDDYEAQNDPSPVSGDFGDNSYAHETRSELKSHIPVVRDEANLADPMQPPFSNSDQQLERDEREAIDRSNILGGERLRHAKPNTQNKYDEGPGEDDLPEDALYGYSGRSTTGRTL
ncbi:hypothetical protein ETB97_005301 [Aspergillus alliaceus]|uniref:Histone chaperone domain-containing protein n=1 Tax=Petromyces alliaceus TaxID=209559 RepID=A0A5N6FV60_PETAA|nr:uncharacterized protein BDW43DRAFT_310592 [Aspergillus alliaceus]KAB8233916.1 hypothetical protein BDW43DRAFT_310592 [Aspergillus alliaceus]KAE8391129.1 hypothetical protein BDV23DRAFT_153756 [Aspergillus alliaceus]KAF5857770.1 hypothetical protein ETB97_005301 [Aspergillus burnettii]